MRRRLLLVVVATTTLVVVAFAIPLAGLVRSVARDRAITAAERDGAALAPVLALTDDAELIESSIHRTSTGTDGRLAVWLPDGTRLGDATPADATSLAVARDQRTAFTRETGDDLELYAPVLTEAGVSVVRSRLPASLLERGVTTAWAALALVAAGLVVAAALLADRLARTLTREAGAVAATARELAAGDAQARVEPGGTPELADAAHALNVLADRIDELRTAERERVADLSHRLRTPLTALRLDAESAGSDAVVEGVDRLEREMTELIRVARRPLHDSPVAATCDLAAVARERVAFWAALADDDGRRWHADIPDEPAMVRLAADDAGAVLDALIGNVFTHTPDGTRYAVSMRVGADDVELAVDDAGPGIDHPHTKLARGATGRGSSGLGLDIARQAATAAGGTIEITGSELGGARIRLRLPQE